ncbi:hypothetical protein TSAR_014454 [Trichomalopsis sarcophagae]|uniref:Uncharacterized protein n=1 Tax=Trichomalopsis sarcophagae TaxID=543379 RepID=A0A232F8Z9_9HYME|nr:hypothetical protein TSAR_014454 [Trichomalopsis sarcophagae]
MKDLRKEIKERKLKLKLEKEKRKAVCGVLLFSPIWRLPRLRIGECSPLVEGIVEIKYTRWTKKAARVRNPENKPNMERIVKENTIMVQGRDTPVPAPTGCEQAGSQASSSGDRNAAEVGHSAPAASNATSDSGAKKEDREEEAEKAFTLLSERIVSLVDFVLPRSNIHKEIKMLARAAKPPPCSARTFPRTLGSMSCHRRHYHRRRKRERRKAPRKASQKCLTGPP